ncbi:MAG: hypothetical protein Q9168_003376 [Polycauliona sp. 1 TL-2023]
MTSTEQRDTKRDSAQMEEVSDTPTEVKDKKDLFPERCGKRLKSTPITIIAGPDKEAFHLHQNVAAQSPVLAELCLKASDSLQVDLPEESAHNIGHLLEYLYSKDFSALSDDNEFVRTNKDQARQGSDELCQIYALAEKYQLPGLQKCVVGKLEAIKDDSYPPIAFLDTAQKMYRQISESDKIYREFFVKTIKPLLQHRMDDKAVQKWIDEQVFQDAKLGKDVFTAQRELFLQRERELRETENRLGCANQEIDEDNENLARLRNHHEKQHRDYCEWQE